MTQIYELSNRIVLLKRKIMEEEDGSFKEYWEESDQIWAQIIPLMGKEQMGEGWNHVNTFQSRYKVTIRNRMVRFSRLKWGEITLALLCPPIIDQQRKWLTCFSYDIGENHE